MADGLADFETGEQADDTAALAIARSLPAAGAGQLGSARRPQALKACTTSCGEAPPDGGVALPARGERARDAAQQDLQVPGLGVGAHRAGGDRAVHQLAQRVVRVGAAPRASSGQVDALRHREDHPAVAAVGLGDARS